MNAFSKNYVPVLKVDDMLKAAKIRQARVAGRQRDLESDDPEAVRRAQGDLGGLSKNGLRPNYKRTTEAEK
ncbi:MAG: hypothetical protein KKD97_16270 [Gammaproteobacteria bacterium]|nr:hypothetical protein [Gammaproteobacteria bacterium]